MPVNNMNVEVNRPASPVFGVAGVVDTVGVVGGVTGVVCGTADVEGVTGADTGVTGATVIFLYTCTLSPFASTRVVTYS